MKKHVCTICGFIYDEALPFENLKENYQCPICGVNKDKFQFLVHNHKEAFLKINYGLYLITAKNEIKDNGCIIDALMQLSDNPPSVAFSINKNNLTHEILKETKEFNISVLTEEAPKELFNLFGTKSGRDVNKFLEFTDASRSENKLLYLKKYTNARLSGRITDMKDASTHTLFTADITDSEVFNKKDTLSYNTYQKELKYKQMFCFQCQQTARGTGCTMTGVCGKKPEVAYEQDLLSTEMINLAKAMADNNLNSLELIDWLVDGLFSTITNVNFKSEKINEESNKIKQKRLELGGIEVIRPKELFAGNTDIVSLRSTLLFGLRGMAAYAHHARVLGRRNPEVDLYFIKGLKALGEKHEVEKWLELLMEFGAINLKCMALLDEANTKAFGNPVPTKVEFEVEKGPFIVVTGHDLQDLKELLEQTKDKGINIYTHGEMLPAHGYPKLKKYPHLKGNFGTAWQNQQNEFTNLLAPVLFTTNCLMPPKGYSDRIFTTSVVAFDGVKHVATDKNGKKDFSEIIDKALELGGFQENRKLSGINGGQNTTTGFGRKAVLDKASEIITAVKEGAIKHFFLVGGCDGAQQERSYYTDFVKKTPKDTIVLTLACGKYRFNDLNIGEIGPFPRILDIGQCNDAYSAIVIASALAEAFNCNINELPLTLVLSWYEQKAVCILLTLLSLGIKNIYIGPTIPAFFSENVLKVITEKFNLQLISNPDDDLKKILTKK